MDTLDIIDLLGPGAKRADYESLRDQIQKLLDDPGMWPDEPAPEKKRKPKPKPKVVTESPWPPVEKVEMMGYTLRAIWMARCQNCDEVAGPFTFKRLDEAESWHHDHDRDECEYGERFRLP